MASSGDEGRVVVDLRSAAESTAAAAPADGAGREEARATPVHEIESLCMRCGENVSAPLSLPPVFICSVHPFMVLRHCTSLCG
jgi:zinc finger protein